MTHNKKAQLQYMTDLLCVWAYVGQVRLNELEKNFAQQLTTSHHFISLFGCTQSRINAAWEGRGGFDGYGDHVAEVCADFEHVQLHADVWHSCRPASSTTSHAFLKAVEIVAPQKLADTAWATRLAFFKDGRNIGMQSTLFELAEELALPVAEIEAQLKNGAAYAALCVDQGLKEKWALRGSPSYVLNEGRQILYGNVGYRILEANVNEVLQGKEQTFSWC